MYADAAKLYNFGQPEVEGEVTTNQRFDSAPLSARIKAGFPYSRIKRDSVRIMSWLRSDLPA